MTLKFGFCLPARWMRIRMENLETLTPDGITDFLRGSAEIEFS
jgi:hypothetical protein